MRVTQTRAFSLWRRNPRRTKALVAVAALAAAIPVMVSQTSGGVSAVPNLPVIPSSTQFDVTGFLQSATLDQTCVTAAGATLDAQGKAQAAHCGGTMVINGQT